MFHHGFYTIFLLISLGFGLVVFVLGSVIVRLSSQGHKPKAPALKDFQNKISKVKTQEEAFALVELFYKDFGTISPHSKRLQEWLDTVKSLSGLDFIDTD